MGLQSLRDKLLQAGLVNEEQAKKAEADLAAQKKAGRDRRQAQERGRQGAPGRDARGAGRGQRDQQRPRPQAQQQQQPRKELTPEQILARQEEAAFRERERELNREREENRKRAVEDRKRLEALRSLAEKNEITERGDDPFHFPSRKRKLVRIYLSKEQIAALEKGELAIIDKPLPSELTQALVPRAAAEEALSLDPRTIRFYNRGAGETYGFQADEAQEEEGGEAPGPGADEGTNEGT